MAMSASGFGAEDAPMSDINTTPLVDVMLVLLIIFLIAVPVAIQTIEKLRIPIFASVESKDKVENLLLTVTTTDAGGRSAGEPGYEGCVAQRRMPRLFQQHHTRSIQTKLREAGVLNASTPSSSAKVVSKRSWPARRKVPQVHIRGDINTPWRCVAGAIYNVQVSGYPTVGFISNPVDPNG